MRLTFPNGEHAAINIEQGQVGVGSAAGGGTSVIIPGLSPLHAVFAAGRRGQWLTVPQEAPVVVNARPVKRIAHLRPGDLVCLSGVQVRIESDQPPPEAAENGQGRRSGGDWASAAPRAVLRGMAGIWFGRSLPLQGPRVLGSGSGCDPRVEGEGVLERHALIDLEDGRLVIRAVAPGASLRVNGHAVRSAVLAAGDQIEIGTVRFVLEVPVLNRAPQTAAARAREAKTVASMQAIRVPVQGSTPAPAKRRDPTGIYLLIAAAAALAAALIAFFVYAPKG